MISNKKETISFKDDLGTILCGSTRIDHIQVKSLVGILQNVSVDISFDSKAVFFSSPSLIVTVCGGKQARDEVDSERK